MTDEEKQKLKTAMVEYSNQAGFDIRQPQSCYQNAPGLWNACLATGIDLRQFSFKEFVSSIQHGERKAEVRNFFWRHQ